MKNREGQKYKVIDDKELEAYGISIGDECVMCEDDGSYNPRFFNSDWDNEGKIYFNISYVELIEERPERYASREVNGMDVIDLINHWNLNFCEGNILKYLLRDKGEDESDIEKIIDYAQRELKRRRDCK